MHPEVIIIGFLTLLYAGTTTIISFKYFILNDIVTKLKQWSISAGNNFNNVIKFGTSETLCNETVVNLENVKPISVHGEGSANKLGEIILTWLRTKLRGHPKALLTKDKKETSYPAWLMTQGMVISLKMKDFLSEMGYRGSKSLLDISKVKEQRVDGSYFGYNKKLRCILVHGKPIGDIEIKFIRFYAIITSFRLIYYWY